MPEQGDKPQVFRWSEQPVFYAVLAFVCGVTLTRWLPASPREWLVTAVAMVIAAALLLARKSSWAVLLAAGAFVPCAALLATFETRARPAAARSLRVHARDDGGHGACDRDCAAALRRERARVADARS